MPILPPDESPVMLSALQHYLFCPRQCALIHIEGAWSENFLTASGRQLHERVDQRGGETRRNVHLATALRLVSSRLGLMGVADMVEFHRQETQQDESGRTVAARLPGRSGYWRPFPVEYKRGAPKSHRADEVQLCAQASCLEEMLDKAALDRLITIKISGDAEEIMAVDDSIGRIYGTADNEDFENRDSKKIR